MSERLRPSFGPGSQLPPLTLALNLDTIALMAVGQTLPAIHVPVISLSGMSDPQREKAIALQIDHAARNSGFWQVVSIPI